MRCWLCLSLRRRDLSLLGSRRRSSRLCGLRGSRRKGTGKPTQRADRQNTPRLENESRHRNDFAPSRETDPSQPYCKASCCNRSVAKVSSWRRGGRGPPGVPGRLLRERSQGPNREGSEGFDQIANHHALARAPDEAVRGYRLPCATREEDLEMEVRTHNIQIVLGEAAHDFPLKIVA
jgi:hypothetical protein